MTGIGESSYRRDPENMTLNLENLVYTYSDALVRYAYCYVCNADVAEEVTEDAFAAYCVKHQQFQSMEQARAWLYKAVRSRAVDYLRFHKRHMTLEDVQEVLSCRGPLEDVLVKERKDAIYRCMQALPRQYRAVLQLQYFDGFDIAQTAKILGKSKKQVYNLLTRAKSALKEYLIKEGISGEDL